jgi:tRNA(Ile)-lysidine synthetase-like protein
VDFVSTVRRTIDKGGLLPSEETVVVGVSGGPDSLCLLHILNHLRGDYRIELHAAHLNHRMRGSEADADAAFVAGLAEEWGLPCTVEARDVPTLAREKKLSLEEAARRARYAFLAEVAEQVGAQRIAVGHNADDQTESVLMHWLRGAGLAGLRGMLPAIPLSDYRLLEGEDGRQYNGQGEFNGQRSCPFTLIRPLLEVTRAEIEAYCAEHNLQPRFDRSNLDTTYYRNRLRHELIPYLESYNPGIREAVRRSARVIADDYVYLRAELDRLWPQVVISESDRAIKFDLAAWRNLPTSFQRSTLRQAIHRLRRSLRNINWIHVEDACVALLEKPAGTQVTLPQGLMLTMSYQTFIVADEGYVELPTDLPLLAVDSLPLAVPGTTPLPESPWRVEARLLSRSELPLGWEDNQDPWQAFLNHDVTGSELILRRRQPGDRFQPLGLEGRQTTLREFMINVKIPAQWRHRVPVVASPQHIVWLAGWRVDERARITASTKRVLHLRFARSIHSELKHPQEEVYNV